MRKHYTSEVQTRNGKEQEQQVQHMPQVLEGKLVPGTWQRMAVQAPEEVGRLQTAAEDNKPVHKPALQTVRMPEMQVVHRIPELVGLHLGVRYLQDYLVSADHWKIGCKTASCLLSPSSLTATKMQRLVVI